MTDLRNRIARALGERFGDREHLYYVDADAVIAELAPELAALAEQAPPAARSSTVADAPYPVVAELMAWVPAKWENGQPFTEDDARAALNYTMRVVARPEQAPPAAVDGWGPSYPQPWAAREMQAPPAAPDLEIRNPYRPSESWHEQAPPAARSSTVPAEALESLRLAIKACNGPCLTEKAERHASWLAVSWMQSHGAAMLAAANKENNNG